MIDWIIDGQSYRRTAQDLWLHNHRADLVPPILDVGSREGRGVRRFGWECVTSLDSDPNTNPDILSHIDGPGDELEDKEFATVTMIETLQYVEFPLGAMNTIFEVLRPGGRLFMSAPLLCTTSLPSTDRHRFTEFRVREMLGCFAIESIETIGNLWTVVADSLSWEYRRSGSVRKMCLLPLILLFRALGRTGTFGAHHGGYMIVARKPDYGSCCSSDG